MRMCKLRFDIYHIKITGTLNKKHKRFNERKRFAWFLIMYDFHF